MTDTDHTSDTDIGTDASAELDSETDPKDGQAIPVDTEPTGSIGRRGLLASLAGLGLLGTTAGTAKAASTPLEFGGNYTGDPGSNYGLRLAPSNARFGMLGLSGASDGRGIVGRATSSTGQTIGVIGRTDSSSDEAAGLQGFSDATSGRTYGFKGRSDSTAGRGALGIATADSGNTIGLEGRADSPDGVAVSGTNTAATGQTVGVRGEVNSPDGYGLYTPGDAKVDGTLATIGDWRVAVDDARALQLGAESLSGDAGNVIAGHSSNEVGPDVVGATIGGGGLDNVSSTSPNRVLDDYSTISGGFNNTASARFATIGGANNTASGSGATIGGGLGNTASGSRGTVGGGVANQAIDNFATVGGGQTNTANGPGATVSGGQINSASTDATVSGGHDNTASGTEATVGGGQQNTAFRRYATVGGGRRNAAYGGRDTIGGGENNQTATSGAGDFSYATVGGGASNTASGFQATVGGGVGNTASGREATVGGGYGNTASGDRATVPGGSLNTARYVNSFAAGHRAKTTNLGQFVWADSREFDFAPTGPDRFWARTTGGADFVTGIDSSGNYTAGVTVTAGGGQWMPLSARSAKENVTSVDTRQILDGVRDLEVAEWNYKSQDEEVRHLGPFAGDFYDAFGLGSDPERIGTIDADGVLFGAVQGLAEKFDEKDDRIDELEAENETLRERNDELQARIETVENHLGLDGTGGHPASADD